MSSDLSRLAAVAASSGQEKLTEEIATFKNKTDILFDRATQQATASTDEFAALVKRHPVASIASAFGAGLMIASLMTRSR